MTDNGGLTLRVMSFNIRTATANDGRFSWPQRKHLVIERIRAFDPDLLGLQECMEGEQAGFIQEQLPDYVFLATRRGDDTPRGREMAPLLWRRDAFARLDSGFYWLSRTPEKPGSRLWGARFPRTVTWARLQPAGQGEKTLVMFNTHFDHLPWSSARAAHILLSLIDGVAGGGPAILTGDFNARTGSAAYKILTGIAAPGGPELAASALYDAHADLPAAMGTFHSYGRIRRPFTIDWVLTSPHFELLNSDVDTTHRDGLYPSDHYPLTATLRL
jgi:endonuclease/exonuclease/phosphatase family metal-dependent hydrolase